VIRRRDKERKLTIWCAACSAGQEPYSIAMVLREHFPVLASWQVRILASDLNVQMVKRTQEGRYSGSEVTRGLPPASVSRWFSPAGSDYVAKDDLRRMIETFPLNLLDPWTSIPTCDVLFIRNVLIYFDLDTKKTIFAKVHKALAEDGFLFLGGAESTMNIDERFVRLPYERAGCYRKLGAGEVRDSSRSDRYSVVAPSTRAPAVVVVDGKAQTSPAATPAPPPTSAGPKGLQQSVTEANRRVMELLRTPPPPDKR
jgi:chemotaxis protein methyltransferase CheR